MLTNLGLPPAAAEQPMERQCCICLDLHRPVAAPLQICPEHFICNTCLTHYAYSELIFNSKIDLHCPHGTSACGAKASDALLMSVLGFDEFEKFKVCPASRTHAQPSSLRVKTHTRRTARRTATAI